MKQTLYMESTQISTERTAGEITSVLIRAGANQIATDYENGKIRGLRWTMRISGQDCMFAMPARVEPVFVIINGRRKASWDRVNKKAADQEQAERVAWRQLLRWVQAQVAMIDCGMTQPMEVFFSYHINDSSGRTVFEHFFEQKFKAIAAPGGQ